MNVTLAVDLKSLPEWAALRDLAEAEGPCISIYLAGHRGGAGSRPMRVRLHALLGRAAALLASHNVAVTDRERLLEPLETLAADPEMEAGHADGLVLFRTPQLFRAFRLPWPVEDQAVVEGRAFLRPLVPLMHPRREFLLLALARENTRLLECGPDWARTLALPAGMPASMEEFEGFDTPDHDLMNVASAGPGLGAAKGVRFGTSSFRDKQYHYLHDFCKAIDAGLKPLLAQRGWPLVVAGAEAEVAAYKAINQYAATAEEAVQTSPDGGWSDAELAARARAALEMWRTAEERQALRQFERAGPEKRVTEAVELLRAAATGRVMHLFLTSQQAVPGDVERVVNRPLLAGQFVSKGDDLINAALVETLRHGGDVWSAAPAEGSADCAVLRY